MDFFFSGRLELKHTFCFTDLIHIHLQLDVISRCCTFCLTIPKHIKFLIHLRISTKKAYLLVHNEGCTVIHFGFYIEMSRFLGYIALSLIHSESALTTLKNYSQHWVSLIPLNLFLLLLCTVCVCCMLDAEVYMQEIWNQRNL